MHPHLRGPWGIIFTALVLLVTLFTTSGCRKPAPPQQGWVRLSALAAQHPQQAMVADIDRRLAALLAQDEQVARRSPLEDAPADSTLPTPALPALPTPAPAYQPAPLIEQVGMLDTEARRQALAQERAPALVREERTIRTTLDRELANRIDALRREAADRRQAAGLTYRQRIWQADSRYALAKRRTVGRTRDDQALAVLQRAKREMDDVHADLQRELDVVDEWQDQVVDDARRESARKFREARAELRRKNDEEIERLIAEEERQLRAEVRAQAPPAPVPAMDLPATPAGEIRLEHAALAEAVQQGNVRAAAGQEAARMQIAETVAALQAQRQELLRAIENDTREAARSLAAAHGYQLHFDARRGKEITASVRTWLHEYWAPSL